MNALATTHGARIRQLHLEARDLAEQAIERALEAGRLLAEVKAELKHGEFGSWVSANCGFTDRTARRYMRLYENRDALPVGGGIRAALEHLKSDTVSVFDLDALDPFEWVRIVLADGAQVVDITPSSEHPGYLHIGIMEPTGDGADVCGTRRPVKPGFVRHVLDHELGNRWRRGSMDKVACPLGMPGNIWITAADAEAEEAA